jgi:hypothetical protein
VAGVAVLASSAVKILFSTTSPALLRNFESVVSELARRGHEVHIARHLPGSSPKEVGVVERLVEAHPGVTAGEVPAPDELMHPFALAVRGMRDYVHFLDPSFNASYRLRAERRVTSRRSRASGRCAAPRCTASTSSATRSRSTRSSPPTSSASAPTSSCSARTSA